MKGRDGGREREKGGKTDRQQTDKQTDRHEERWKCNQHIFSSYQNVYASVILRGRGDGRGGVKEDGRWRERESGRQIKKNEGKRNAMIGSVPK